MIKERRYRTEELWDRLRIIYRRVDAVRRNIDESLATDDRLRRQRGKMEFRSPYRFLDPTEMENSTLPTWIQWISREANKLCNELNLMIDQETNETLSEFQPIPEDVEPEGEVQPDLMGPEMLQTTKEVENRGEEGNSPQEGLQEPPTQPQLDTISTTRANVHQTMERNDNITPRLEENNEQTRPQETETLQENVQEQTEQTPQNQTEGSPGGTFENYAENSENANLNGNQHDITNNNMNPSHVPEYRSKNSQNYFKASTQQTIKTPQQAILSKNRNEFGENSRSSLNQSSLMASKPQRLQKNGGVRRNLMRSRNIGQNREPQDVHLLEMSKSHQQSNWWPTNQPDATSYLQLPPRKFIDQRKQVVNYDEEEDLSWCNKCGEPGHIRAFCTARVFCSFCRMRSHSNKACWNQPRSERVEPFSSSRQTTPVQNPIQQTQTQNYSDQGIRQNPALINRMETANKPWENKSVQIDHHEMGLQYGNVPHHQNYYQRVVSRDHTSQETSIPQQRAQNAAQQKKITKTQAIQVNETDEGEGQINRVTLKRPVHQGSMEERCLRKEPFFVNHYYSHPVGQCCCQQHAMLVKEGQITLQSSTTLNHEKSKNS